MIYPAKRTILVAAVNATLRDILAEILERAGYAVALASNGQEALDCFGKGVQPDLILSDLQMPVLDGRSLLEQLKAVERMRPVPVVVMALDEMTRERALTSGWAGFVAKPFQEDALLDQIQRCLNSP
jgi:two-component system chemotaxis response regulator CheY